MANSEILSIRFDAPLCVELNPSTRLRRLLLLCGASALVCIAVLPWPLFVRLIVGLLLVLVCLLEWWRTCGSRPLALRWEQGAEWSAKFGEDWRPAIALRCTHLSASLVVVEVTVKGRLPRRYAILSDQTDPQSWRRLRRRLQRPTDSSGS